MDIDKQGAEIKAQHARNVKAALNYLGPRAVLALLHEEIADRMRCSCSNHSRQLYARTAAALSKAAHEMGA